MALTNKQRKTIQKLKRQAEAGEVAVKLVPSLRESQRLNETELQRADRLLGELNVQRDGLEASLHEEAAFFHRLCIMVGANPNTAGYLDVVGHITELNAQAEKALQAQLDTAKTKLEEATTLAEHYRTNGSQVQQRRLAAKSKELEELRIQIGQRAVAKGELTIPASVK